MRRNIVKLSILAISLILMAFTLKAAFKKEKLPELSDEKIELLEDAIMISSLSEESDSEDYQDVKESFDDIQSNQAGEIYLVDNFVPEKSSEIRESGDSLLKSLRKQDKRWHFTDYVIRKGDNLWTIGKKFGVSHKTIIRANSINNPDQLKPGKTIKIPNTNGIYYSVKSGDTLSEISVKYKTDADVISVQNSLKKNKILKGSRIFIPDAVEPAVKKTVTHAVSVADKKTETKSSDAKTVAIAKSDKIIFSWPVKGKITSSFGMRNHPVYRKQKFHNGIDIGAETGTKVSAAADGKVVFTGVKEGYGNLIVIEHSNNYITVYAHLSEMNVKKDEIIREGEVIGLTGATGTVTGPNLHFEVRKYLTPLNPLVFMRK